MRNQGLVCQECRSPTDLMSGLHFMWIELTEKCNLECVHCYVSSSPHLPLIGAVQPKQRLSLIEEGRALGCGKIQFIGGEATIYPALPELIGHANNLGFKFIEVFTNGVSFPKKLREAFVGN